MATKILSTTIEEKNFEQLKNIASKTNRKRSYYVNEALKLYFEEIRDYEIALSRKGKKSISISKAEIELGF